MADTNSGSLDKHDSDKRPETVALIVEPASLRVINLSKQVDAFALFACIADDPRSWDDLAILWPRGKFDAENTEFIDALPCKMIDIGELPSTERLADVSRTLENADGWFAADLAQQRLFSGGDFPLFRLRSQPAPKERLEEIIVLPPWWLFQQEFDARDIRVLWSERSPSANIPDPHRKILWSQHVTEFLASRLIDEVKKAQSAGDPWFGKDWDDEIVLNHELAVVVHRDWYMTPRSDLDQLRPRDCLHGGTEWISDLADGQRFRLYEKQEAVPVEDSLSTFTQAPMGRNEVIMYFDACRGSILEGGRWLIENQQTLECDQVVKILASVMWEFMQQWLVMPLEGGRPPCEIIRCDRARIPLVVTSESHIIDCDGPLCLMMLDDRFGPTFSNFDGHHLELDEEFAFSLCATREEWERQQSEFAEISARIDADMKLREEKQVAGNINNDSALDSTRFRMAINLRRRTGIHEPIIPMENAESWISAYGDHLSTQRRGCSARRYRPLERRLSRIQFVGQAHPPHRRVGEHHRGSTKRRRPLRGPSKSTT